MNNIKFDKTFFLKSIIDCSAVEDFFGIEVAFLGRSNSGKSSLINCLTNNKQLARVSKLPGRTRTINLFNVLSDFRIIDFPGYGYSKIDHVTQNLLNNNLFFYLRNRKCLRGIVFLSDIRRSLQEYDKIILKKIKLRLLPVLIILTKSDKVSKQYAYRRVFLLRKKLIKWCMKITILSFSKFNKSNISAVIEILSLWYVSSLHRQA
ncbi:ribosome biogenesis GTP-binding protein YihA/YsxC [Buchnera aphidicola]|uniref:ribosome biogenesis GTP-binding protein YihA/YsxC n=1 Tax=Buchnera aphidicola TaxID=9 RepID=UPI00094D1D0B|nr:ribosome biogenesis GTP-binding protein YihA/YsxC [Buchnera aphidicola]